jgi:hypothetical protein
MKLSLALLQIPPAQGDQGENLNRGIRCCREVKERGADLVVFPELWNIGFAPCPPDAAGKQAWESSAMDQKGQFFEEFVAQARELTPQYRDNLSCKAFSKAAKYRLNHSWARRSRAQLFKEISLQFLHRGTFQAPD